MVAVPPDTPVKLPVAEPIVAMDALLLLHVPPEVVSFNVVVAPAHRTVVPLMGPSATTVT